MQGFPLNINSIWTCLHIHSDVCSVPCFSWLQLTYAWSTLLCNQVSSTKNPECWCKTCIQSSQVISYKPTPVFITLASCGCLHNFKNTDPSLKSHKWTSPHLPEGTMHTFKHLAFLNLTPHPLRYKADMYHDFSVVALSGRIKSPGSLSIWFTVYLQLENDAPALHQTLQHIHSSCWTVLYGVLSEKDLC